MTLSKRDFLKFGAAAVAATAVSPIASRESRAADLSDMTVGVKDITVTERLARIAKAQRLMTLYDIDAILLEPGSAMLYFTGISWWRSERLTAVIIPREGDIAVVTPYFEEPSVRESMTFGDDVRTWHEHEDPFGRVQQILKDRGVAGGMIGLEDSVRYFVVKGLQETGDQQITSAEGVTRGCRMYKSPAELKLLRKANEITLTAYGHIWQQLKVGMTPGDVKQLMQDTQNQLGGRGTWGMALFGEASAYPHGSGRPQTLKEGDVVLMDCGTSVHGYQSDISRTFVFGDASKRQRQVWDTVRQGQQVTFEAARIYTPAGKVDAAVRAYYESLGYGPGYETPGLSHRTGHGIGMDGHEPVNFVLGETTKLAPGMCFSNEPGLYIYGEFGVRLEDCIYMTGQGPKWFTEPPESLDDPIGKMGPVIA